MRSGKFFIRLIIPGVLLTGLFAGIISCQHQADNLYVQPEICFDSQILPIFQNNCAISGCHNGSNESGYDFQTYQGIEESVVPGNPLKSPAYRSITAFWGESAMPPKQPLSEDNRTLIRLWIEQGARRNNCSVTPGGNPGDSTYYNPRACFTRDILPIIQANCAIPGCHDGSSSGEEDAPRLTTYNNIRNIVVPKSPSSSKLYRVITSGGEEFMPPPPQSPLTSAQIDSIYSWIRYGALNEDCGSICDTAAAVTYPGTVWPIIQTYCYGCHSGTNAQKGQHLENYQDVSTAAASGKLLGALKGQAGYVLMPPAGSLSSCEISEIEKWVNNGSPNNRMIQ